MVKFWKKKVRKYDNEIYFWKCAAAIGNGLGLFGSFRKQTFHWLPNLSSTIHVAAIVVPARMLLGEVRWTIWISKITSKFSEDF